MKILEQYKGYKPVAHAAGETIFYSRGKLWKQTDGKMNAVAELFEAGIKDKSRFTVRLFRRELKHAALISDRELLAVGYRKIQLVDLATGEVQTVHRSRDGFSDPLNICTECENYSAVWGDYGPNENSDSINIYGLTPDRCVKIVYTFEPGAIRHIHNIIPDLSGGFYIFTGDVEKTSGIYQASADFKTVSPVMTGSQKYRAVVGFDTPRGLLYATDSVNDPNHIYLLDEHGMVSTIADLEGTCIYGTKYKGKYYFSTTVEPDERVRGVRSWFSFKRGEGILSDNVCLICVDESLKASEILRMKKDRLPTKLMQYGSILFPKGEGDEFWIYPVAVRKYDGNALRILQE